MLYFLTVIAIVTSAQKVDSTTDVLALVKKQDSIVKSLKYEHGVIKLKNNVAQITIPPGFKYLNAAQARTVLVELWGNPDDTEISQGLILPENSDVISDSTYVFNIQYDEIGFVKDDDADKINYDDLLKDMKEEAIEENKEREKQGFPSVNMVGWASPPYYDKNKKILHWAKNIKFGDSDVNTLNYNIRILGRKGVLVLNAISTMPYFELVKKDIPKIMNIVEFYDGNQYKDFDSSVDKVAAWTIGGLVAGKVLAKLGFLGLILKFGKVIALAVVAFFSTIGKRLFNKKEDSTTIEQQKNDPDIES